MNTNKKESTISYLRSFRILNFAIFDFSLAFFGMFLLGIYFKHPVNFLLATLPVSVLFHLLIGNMTPLTKMTLESGHYSVKILMIILIILSYIY